MSYDIDSVYALLPAYIRTRDEQLGRRLRAESELTNALDRPALDFAPLRSLIGLFAEEFERLADGTEQMYDDLFIETCTEWVVPYIGELVGARLPPAALGNELNARAIVADTIADRRRKGTIGGLERVVDAAVGSWVAAATEYWRLLLQSQHLDHLRLDGPVTFSVDDATSAVPVDTPFDASARTVDATPTATGGRYNIANIGIDVWRTVSQRRRSGSARRIDGRRLTFDPFGRSIELYVDPDPVVGDERIERFHVPRPLGRLELHRELAARVPKDLEIVVNGAALSAEELVVCVLADDPADPGGWLNSGPDIFAAERPHGPVDPVLTRVDPALGRIVTGEAIPADAAVEVTYHYGSAAQIGGGSMSRPLAAHASPDDVEAARRVSASGLAAALAAQQTGMVVISDSGSTEAVSTIATQPDRRVTLVADDGHAPVLIRPLLTLRMRPGSELVLDGLWIDADVHIIKPEAEPATVIVRDSTIRPGRTIHAVGPALDLEIERSIVGGLVLARDTRLSVRDSIIDATATTSSAIRGAGGTVELRESTVVGRVTVDRLDMVSNTIIAAARAAPADLPPVRSTRRQVGCIRFSWLPFDSETPQRYSCVPTGPDDVSSPVFVSMEHGDARFAQLDRRTPVEIREGADDGGEMGGLHRLHEPTRAIVLADRLEEFLRFGMEAGVHRAS